MLLFRALVIGMVSARRGAIRQSLPIVTLVKLKSVRKLVLTPLGGLIRLMLATLVVCMTRA